MRPRTWLLLGLIVAGSLVAEQFVHHEHEYWFTGIPGFFVLYGFVGCAAIVYLSKWYGKLWVQRKESYWDEREDADPHLARTGVPDPGATDGPGATDDSGGAP